MNGDGTITSQMPVAGTTVPKGSVLTLQVQAPDATATIEHQVTLSTIKTLRDDTSARGTTAKNWLSASSARPARANARA